MSLGRESFIVFNDSKSFFSMKVQNYWIKFSQLMFKRKKNCKKFISSEVSLSFPKFF